MVIGVCHQGLAAINEKAMGPLTIASYIARAAHIWQSSHRRDHGVETE